MAKFSISAKLKSRANADGTHPIQVVYLYQREAKEYSTGYATDKASWDSVKKLVNPHTEDALTVNQKIQQVQALLYSVASKMEEPNHAAVKAGYAVAAEEASKKEKADLLKWIGHGTGAIEKMKRDSDVEFEEAFGLMIAEQGVRDYTNVVNRFKETVEVLQPKAKKNRILQNLEKRGIYVSDDAKQKEKDLFKQKQAEYLKERELLDDIKKSTLKQMRSLFNNLDKFEAAKKFPLSFDKMGFEFYKVYGDWVLNDEDNFDGYYGSLVKRLRTWLGWCVEQGVSVNPQFRSKKFKALKEEFDVVYLNTEELNWLDEFRNHATCKPSWIRVIDMALVQASIGCRYSDMVDSSWFYDGDMLKGFTTKNKSKYVIPLKSSNWLQILKKYNMTFKLPVRHSDKVAVLSDQKFNKYLKECLQGMYATKGLHIEEHERMIKKQTKRGVATYTPMYKYELISSHSLRRSFVSRMVRAGYRIEQVALMIGTKNTKELEKYFKLEEDDLRIAANQIHG